MEVVDGRLIVDGVAREYTVSRYGDTVFVDRPGASVALGGAALRRPSSVQRPGSLLAPMPGLVIRVVRAGRPRDRGPAAAVVEAMKMEHNDRRTEDGVVATLAVEVGRQLAVGDVLAVIEAEDASADA